MHDSVVPFRTPLADPGIAHVPYRVPLMALPADPEPALVSDHTVSSLTDSSGGTPEGQHHSRDPLTSDRVWPVPEDHAHLEPDSRGSFFSSRVRRHQLVISSGQGHLTRPLRPCSSAAMTSNVGTFPANGVAINPRRPSSAHTRCSATWPASLVLRPDSKSGPPFLSRRSPGGVTQR
jgi:hypothetical protein